MPESRREETGSRARSGTSAGSGSGTGSGSSSRTRHARSACSTRSPRGTGKVIKRRQGKIDKPGN
ncbi:MAG: hypothetical protein V1766_12840 [Pseudomonadota bacterium]